MPAAKKKASASKPKTAATPASKKNSFELKTTVRTTVDFVQADIDELSLPSSHVDDQHAIDSLAALKLAARQLIDAGCVGEQGKEAELSITIADEAVWLGLST